MENFVKIIIGMIFLFISSSTLASIPTCHSSNGGYCQYTGKVEKIYVNAKSLILIYFDSAVPLDLPASVGINVTNGGAASFKIDANPEFAKLLYSTALEAQASGREVTIQMSSVNSGYLQIDNIWLSAP
ncbi:MAG: hypothetical protein ACI8WB_005046 [Phenylobacterium sp.]|jgi:hypothetical protein